MNTLVIISGHSGAGKTTVIRKVMDNEIVSFTTRPPRGDEVDGVDYHFIDRESFNGLLQGGGLLETSGYSGNTYGISIHEFYGKIAKDNAFAILDINGANLLKARYKKNISIFLYTDIESATLNLKLRGESDEFIAERLATYEFELTHRHYYDYVVKNVQGHLDETVEIVRNIVKSNI